MEAPIARTVAESTPAPKHLSHARVASGMRAHTENTHKLATTMILPGYAISEIAHILHFFQKANSVEDQSHA